MGRRLFDVVDRPTYQTTGQVLQELTLFEPQFVKAIDVLARQILARHTYPDDQQPILRGKHLRLTPARVRPRARSTKDCA